MLTGRAVLLATTVLEVGFVAWVVVSLVRAVRAGRACWNALEDVLARVMPRRMARLVLLEPRLFGALVQWATRRRRRDPLSFGYHHGVRLLLAVVAGLVLVEGAVADLLLAALASRLWVWVALAVHAYALLWLAGLYASMVVRPHRLQPDGLHVRDGVFAELVVPYDAITGVRAQRRPNVGRSGFTRDAATGTALLAVSDATVSLQLDPAMSVLTPSGPIRGLTELAITVDDAPGFRERLDQRLSAYARTVSAAQERSRSS